VAAVALSVALAGCGDARKLGKSQTRPIELMKTAPAGYRYEPPNPQVRKEVRGPIEQAGPFSKDDVAVRQVVAKGEKAPIAIAIVIDAHASGKPGDAIKGFDGRIKQMGATPTKITVAGTPAGLAQVKKVQIALAGKNGYVVESVSPDEAVAKTVLARLIFAARGAKR
jgi:hypothetical protein